MAEQCLSDAGPLSDPWRTRPSLLIRVRNANDQGAWAEFVEFYTHMIAGWCRKHYPRETDDMTQEVLAKLIRLMGSFEYRPEKGKDGKGGFRAWLRRVTLNLMQDLRGRQLAGVNLEHHDVQEHLAREAARRDLVERLEATMLVSDRWERAKEVVRSRVEPKTWFAFVERIENGREYDEIALEIGTSIGAVYQRVFAVKELLKEVVKSMRGPSCD